MGLFNKKNKKVVFQSNNLEKTLHKNLEFTASEQYRLLRTNINFTIPGDVKCPVIGITSSIRDEGKSTTAINLAYVLAEKGLKVLLIDGDLRLPSIAKKMDIAPGPGLTDMLLNPDMDMEQWASKINKSWYILPSGDIPPNPSELLGSSRMEKLLDKMKEKFDYIILDLPPVNLVSDAVSVSGFITGMVVIVREEYTTKKDLEQCFRQLKLSNVKILGCVMNESGGKNGYYRKYGKYGRYKYYKHYGDNGYENRQQGEQR